MFLDRASSPDSFCLHSDVSKTYPGASSSENLLASCTATEDNNKAGSTKVAETAEDNEEGWWKRTTSWTV